MLFSNEFCRLEGQLFLFVVRDFYFSFATHLVAAVSIVLLDFTRAPGIYL